MKIQRHLILAWTRWKIGVPLLPTRRNVVKENFCWRPPLVQWAFLFLEVLRLVQDGFEKSNLNQMKDVKIPKNPKLPDARGKMKAFFDKNIIRCNTYNFSIA